MNWRGSCLSECMTSAGRAILLLAGAAALIAGCKAIDETRQSLANTPRIYAVANDGTAFFTRSPQQGNGPDRTLPRDTLVRLIRPSFGYAKVQLIGDNEQGYVSSDDIRVAPPKLVEAATATPPPLAAASRAPSGEQFDLNSTDPRLSAPPDQLPAPDLPPAGDLPAPDQPTASPAPPQ